MAKTQEQRIEDAARELKRMFPSVGEASAAAKKVLEAADREPPKWPTDESVRRFKAAYRSSTNSDVPMSDEWLRDCLREAMVHDPIHEAAVAVRDGYQEKVDLWPALARLNDTVYEAEWRWR